jgi:hypothetical protein
LLVLACRACQEGRGPHSSGRSGSGVSWWVRRSISWFQYFSFEAFQSNVWEIHSGRCVLVECLWIGGVGSWRCSSFQSFVVFQLVEFHCSMTWSSFLQAGRGPRINFPM